MRLALQVFLLYFSFVFGKITENNGIWVLDQKNFAEALELQSDLFVEFYDPSCQYCKKFAPEYEKIAKILSENAPPVKIASVNVISNPNLAREYKIKNLPTLIYFSNGEFNQYSGKWESDVIAN